MATRSHQELGCFLIVDLLHVTRCIHHPSSIIHHDHHHHHHHHHPSILPFFPLLSLSFEGSSRIGRTKKNTYPRCFFLFSSRYIQHFCPGLGWTLAKVPMGSVNFPAVNSPNGGIFVSKEDRSTISIIRYIHIGILGVSYRWHRFLIFWGCLVYYGKCVVRLGGLDSRDPRKWKGIGIRIPNHQFFLIVEIHHAVS